jgi:hypothetical protein
LPTCWSSACWCSSAAFVLRCSGKRSAIAHSTRLRRRATDWFRLVRVRVRSR